MPTPEQCQQAELDFEAVTESLVTLEQAATDAQDAFANAQMLQWEILIILQDCSENMRQSLPQPEGYVVASIPLQDRLRAIHRVKALTTSMARIAQELKDTLKRN